MQELLSYEYAIIRLVPRVEREEFINVGVVMFCKKNHFIDCRIVVNEKKLYCLSDKIDLLQILKNLDAFKMIATGMKESKSVIANLDVPSRFRWLTATRSTIIQCSKVHPGITSQMEDIIEKLLQQFVL